MDGHTAAGVFLSLLLVICGRISTAKDLPDFMHACHRSDPNFDQCLIDSAHSLKPHFVEGVPEYNIPSLEPLLIDELVASENTAGLRITANKVKAYGASDFTATKLKVNMVTKRYDIDVLLPHLYVEAQYAIDGKVLLLPIKGNGPMHGNFTNCKGRVVLLAEIYDKDDDKYLRYTSMTIKIKIGNGNIQLDNLFGGEKLLGEVVNGAINSNFDAFVTELLPVIETALARVFLQTANNIVEQFTHEQLFPY